MSMPLDDDDDDDGEILIYELTLKLYQRNFEVKSFRKKVNILTPLEILHKLLNELTQFYSCFVFLS